jgi:hypothetical protein
MSALPSIRASSKASGKHKSSFLSAATYLSIRVIFNDCKACFSAGVAELGQRRRVPLKRDADASGAYPAEVRGFESHPLHQ